MALLQKARVLSNQRLDLPDFNNLSDFVCSDFQAIHKNVWVNQNVVISGFSATGIGTTQLDITLPGSSLISGEDNGNLFIGAPSLGNLSTSNLTPSTTNFIEIFIDTDTGGADSRAFWDPTAAGGEGAEFSQIVDTFIFTKANLSVSTSNFTGDPDKTPICEVDVNSSGVITAIRDSRSLMFRLGRPSDVGFNFPWASRTEPLATQFTGADKDIKTMKQWYDAVMSSIKEVKGTTAWFEDASVSLTGSFRNTGLSVLVGNTASARFRWTGTNLLITDDAGAPLGTDILATLRVFDSASNIELTRQDGGNSIALADGEILWVELPDPLANVSYDAVGLTSTNYRVDARGSVPLNDSTYWLAYREGTRIYLRGLGELEAGEEKQVNDETTTSLRTFLGFDPEIATSVPYTAFPDPIVFGNVFDTNDTLVEAISTNTANINAVGTVLDENAYSEAMDVVSGVPANDNEIQGPVTVSTLITLPLDSRDGDTQEQYVVGEGILKVFLNGQLMIRGRGFAEVGAPTTLSQQIEILQQLEIGDVLEFRVDSLGGFNVGGGGGGGGGDVTGASNLGPGEGEVFKQKNAGILELRTIKAGAGISIVTDTINDQIIISLTGGAPEAYFNTCINGQTANIVNTGNNYNLGTDKLMVYRNGVLMTLSTSIGSAVDRYQEATNNSVLIETTPIASEVFCFVNDDTNPISKVTLTGITGTLVTVPSYTLGNDGLLVFRNGVLLNSNSLGTSADQYSETSTTSITLGTAAVATDVFIIYNKIPPTFREDLTSQTGTTLTVSSPYSVGTGELLVFRNGVLMFNSLSLGSAVDRYQESSSTTIELETAAVATDLFYFLNK